MCISIHKLSEADFHISGPQAKTYIQIVDENINELREFIHKLPPPVFQHIYFYVIVTVGTQLLPKIELTP